MTNEPITSQESLHRAIGRVEGKLDALTAQMSTHVSTTALSNEKTDRRLSTLEKQSNIIKGSIAVITVIFTGIVGWFKMNMGGPSG